MHKEVVHLHNGISCSPEESETKPTTAKYMELAVIILNDTDQKKRHRFKQKKIFLILKRLRFWHKSHSEMSIWDKFCKQKKKKEKTIKNPSNSSDLIHWLMSINLIMTNVPSFSL